MAIREATGLFPHVAGAAGRVRLNYDNLEPSERKLVL